MITINNTPVKETESIDDKGIPNITYKYFACSCKENDHDFYKNLIDTNYPDINNDLNKNRKIAYFIEELRKIGWKLSGFGSDQWMGADFYKFDYAENKEYCIALQFDELEFGMVTALTIAKKIEEEKSR